METSHLPVEKNIQSNGAELKTLAIKFNLNMQSAMRSTEAYQTEMLRVALDNAQILKEGSQLTSTEGFDTWTKEELGIGKTRAYEYIALLDNSDLKNFGFHTSGKIKISHLFALLPRLNETEATEQARKNIMQRIDKGEQLSVRKIQEELKNTQKKAIANEKDRDNWRDVAAKRFDEIENLKEQNNQLKNNIDIQVQQSLQEKLATIEEQALAKAEAEYLPKINALTDKEMFLRNQLRIATQSDEKQTIQEQINQMQIELEQIQSQKNNLQINKELRQLANHHLLQLQEANNKLIEITVNDVFILEPSTQQLLHRLEHDSHAFSVVIAEITIN